MAAPIPGSKSWSASNATSGSTYETTGPMVTELPTGKFGDITKFGAGIPTAATALIRSALRSPTIYETAKTVVKKVPPRRMMPDIRDIIRQQAKAKGTYVKLSQQEIQALYPKIAQILKMAAEGEGGGGGNPEMEAMKMDHAEENHEQDMRHKEELHNLKMRLQELALQQKEEAAAIKQQEMGMQMPPEPLPPQDPAQQQSMIDTAYDNLQNKEPDVGPLKEGAYIHGYQSTLSRLGILF